MASTIKSHSFKIKIKLDMKDKDSKTEKSCNIADVSNSVCSHEFIAREYTSQPYGTCLACGRTILTN